MITIKDLIEMSPFIPQVYLVDAAYDTCALDLVWILEKNYMVINYDYNGTISFVVKIKSEDICRGIFRQKDGENEQKTLDFFKEIFGKFKGEI